MAPPPQPASLARRAQRLLRLRRGLAGVLLLTAVVVLGLYLVRHHASQRALVRNQLSIPKLGLTIQQSAHGVTIAKDSNGKPVFRVYAERADKLRGSNRDELRNVRIVVYDSDGVHADQISGSEFAYDESTGEATAGGPVTIDAALESGAAGQRAGTPAPPTNSMHIEAQDLTLNVKTGIGTIARGLQFSYLNAHGAAGQARVDSHAGVLQLGGTVHVSWTRPNQPDLVIAGDHAELRRLPAGGPDAALLTLSGDASLHSGDTSASAGAFIFHWRANHTLRHVDAIGQIHASQTAVARHLTVSADAAHADFLAAGPHHTAVNHLALAGAVAIAERTPQEHSRLTAASAAFLFGPSRRLTQLQARGDRTAPARLLLVTQDRSQSIAAPALDFHFAAPSSVASSAAPRGNSQAPRAERAPVAGERSPPPSDQRERPSKKWRATSAPGTEALRLEAVDAHSDSGAEGSAPVQLALSSPARSGHATGPVQAQADQLHLALNASQQPTLATASGDVRLRQSIPGPDQSTVVRTSSSDLLVLHFAASTLRARRPGGELAAGATQLARAVATGHVDLRQADRRLQADAADYDVVSGRIVLSAQPHSAYTQGRVHGSDSDTTFTAPRVVWIQSADGSSRLLASGGISLSRAGGKPASAATLTSPVVITAQSLRWDQPPPTAPSTSPLPAIAGFVPQLTGTGVFTGGVRLVQAPNLLRADRVTVDGAQRQLSAAGHVETVFLPARHPALSTAPSRAPSATTPALPPAPVIITADALQYRQLAGQADYQGHVQVRADGAELTTPQLEVGLSPQAQLTTALARGGVRITQPGRTLTAQQANFDFRTRRGELSGGPPSILDAEQGRMSGDPLTFSLSSDEIRVGSKSGARASGQTTIRPR